jgi:RimJ/RimL family protein N-acetyltransferase
MRIYLRALEPQDYLTSIKWRNDDVVWNLVGSPKYFVSSEYEKNWVQENIFNKDKLVLAICLKEDNRYIGNAILSHFDWINRSATSGTLIGDKSEWGKGYGTESHMLRLKFAFRERGLERVTVYILESNIGSQKAVEKCGYVKEGLLRNSLFKDGKFHNQYIMSVLRADWEKIAKDYNWE